MNSQPAVILTIQKQPGADTLTLDRKIRATLDDIQATLPADVKIDSDIFRQANFINVAIKNVEEAIRDGAVWVVVVLFIFLWNFRTSIITLTAIPLSIIVTALVFHFFGLSINTMTLGGLAVAIGELVDDSIVDVENIYRRLKENRANERPDNPLKVIFLASAEVRNSIVYATLIVVLVVLPLFSLGGLEGRMFAPLGLSYLLTLLASLGVSLTVTPVLASYVLPTAKFLEHAHDPALLRWLKRLDERLLHITLRHAWVVLAITAVLATVSVVTVAFMGGEFMPPFNEGTLTIGSTAPPATSLDESNRIGRLTEDMLRPGARGDAHLAAYRPRRDGRTCRERELFRNRRGPCRTRAAEAGHLLCFPARFPASTPGVLTSKAARATRCWPTSARACNKCRAWSTTSASRFRIGLTISCRASGRRSPSSCTGSDLQVLRAKARDIYAIMQECRASLTCKSSRKSKSRRCASRCSARTRCATGCRRPT